jgi:hypothetical protein
MDMTPCQIMSTALEREVGKEILGLILKNGHASMFPHYGVPLRGGNSGGPYDTPMTH